MLREGDVETALAREIALWEAFRARDRAALERLIDPLAVDVGPSGTRTRCEVLDAVDAIDLRAFTIDGLVVREDGGVSVVTYRASVDGRYRERPFRFPRVQASSVWLERAGRASLVARCETPIDEDARTPTPP